MPDPSGISKWLYRHICQEVCPWNEKLATALAEGSPFSPREALGSGRAMKDARTLARELLAMTQEEFSAAFRGSPMKRAKLRGPKRNAAMTLGNAGTHEDIDALTRALDDPEPLAREHAAWAIERLEPRTAAASERTSSSLP